MKKTALALVLVLVLLLVVVGGYWLFIKQKPSGIADEKAVQLVSRKHSALFNENIDSILAAYFNMKDAFVKGDTISAKKACEMLVLLADTAKLAELKNDAPGIYESAIMQVGDVKANAESLLMQTDVIEMKQDFRMIGESIYPLLKTIHYDGKTLYWQNCPMAFGEDKGANWISNTVEVINPYLGAKADMLHCGENKDSIKAE